MPETPSAPAACGSASELSFSSRTSGSSFAAAAAARLEPDVRLLRLNSEAEPQAAASLGVSGIPALLLYRDGAVIARSAGLMSSAQIVAWTHQALAQANASAAKGG